MGGPAVPIWQALLIGLLPAALAFTGVALQIRSARKNLTKTIDAARTSAWEAVESNDRATWQREGAGKREEWWRRFSWAAELSLDSDESRSEAGFRVLEVLRQSPLARNSDKKIMAAFADRKNQAMITDLRAASQASDRTG